jgi:multidrug efflux pump subunit AcrA (membrane-fusion protein)
VPAAAVRQRGGRDAVWVVRDGRVESRAVAVSTKKAGETTLMTGLNDGERIIVEGPDDLTEGIRVTEKPR